MKFIAVRFWDDNDKEDILGEADSKEKAQAFITEDFEEFGSRIFIREHVLYKIVEET